MASGDNEQLVEEDTRMTGIGAQDASEDLSSATFAAAILLARSINACSPTSPTHLQHFDHDDAVLRLADAPAVQEGLAVSLVVVPVQRPGHALAAALAADDRLAHALVRTQVAQFHSQLGRRTKQQKGRAAC